VIFFVFENVFEQAAADGIGVPKKPHDVAIHLDDHSLREQIFAD
jgi:hypothetical protein